MINRPRTSLFDSSMVIKSDQFKSCHEKHIIKVVNPVSFIPLLTQFKMKSSVEDLVKLLVNYHNRTNQLALPDWLKPSPESISIHQEKQLSPIVNETVKSSYFCAKYKVAIS
jgi:hypothetical protein